MQPPDYGRHGSWKPAPAAGVCHDAVAHRRNAAEHPPRVFAGLPAPAGATASDGHCPGRGIRWNWAAALAARSFAGVKRGFSMTVVPELACTGAAAPSAGLRVEPARAEARGSLSSMTV